MKPQCRICQAENRPYIGQTISQYDYLSRAEKRNMIKSFKVETNPPVEEDLDIPDELDQLDITEDE